MKRREFIVVFGGAAASWLAADAQQPEGIRRVGVLMPFADDPRSQEFVAALRQALTRFGWEEGKNIRLDYRFAAADRKRVEAYGAELVVLSPDVILAGNAAAAALLQRTRTIPIVFVFAVDPVGHGLVQSLARPGGNITGFSSYDAAMIGKWLQLLKEVAATWSNPRMQRKPWAWRAPGWTTSGPGASAPARPMS